MVYRNATSHGVPIHLRDVPCSIVSSKSGNPSLPYSRFSRLASPLARKISKSRLVGRVVVAITIDENFLLPPFLLERRG